MAIEKERPVGKEVVGGEREIPQIIDLQEGRAEQPLPREVESWMEKFEKLQQPGQAVTDDQRQTVLQPTAPVNPKIKLPATKKAFVTGFSKAVSDAGKWFSTFLFRLIKIKKGEVEFKNDE